MDLANRTASDWFHEAVSSYNQKHQGCPWCGGTHRVYKSHRGRVGEFHCGVCDFFVCHDEASDRYFVAEGDYSQAAITMTAV